MSLEQGILGFLSVKPMSGYDLKKVFDMSASYFWPANQTLIYRVLKELTKDGYAELKECTKGETVERKVYAITEKGEERFLKAAAESSVKNFVSRDAFMLQLFFRARCQKRSS